MSHKMLQVPAAAMLLLLMLPQLQYAASASVGSGSGGGGGGETTAATSSISERQIDSSLKNAKLIESKTLPDLASLQHNQEDDKWQHIYRFIDDGFPVLGLYGYKTKPGKRNKNRLYTGIVVYNSL